MHITVIQLAVSWFPPVEPARGLHTITHPSNTTLTFCGKADFYAKSCSQRHSVSLFWEPQFNFHFYETILGNPM